MAGFLGVYIDRKDNSTIHLSQPGLTKQIVDAMHLSGSEVKTEATPCKQYIPIDKNGEEVHGEFSYASVVGQLNYLAGHTRINIAFTTSQVARLFTTPKGPMN